MTTNNDSPIIWYIPGFRSGDDPQINVLHWLKRIYPDAAAFESIIWENQPLDTPQKAVSSLKDRVTMSAPLRIASILNSASPLRIFTRTLENFVATPYSSLLEQTPAAPFSMLTKPLEIRWSKALADIKPTSERLVNRVRGLSQSQRQKLILIGHSLGGNIVIRTLANLYRRDITIHSAVLLGAAIENCNEDILGAMKATQRPIHSMFNPNDNTLKYLFPAVTVSRALGGTGCKLDYDRTKFFEHETDYSTTHSSDFYLSQWASIQQRIANLRMRYQSKKDK